ncbi:MAG: SDR family oxidoreductase [Proteobacteria bacterium]|nr:SDR family oxidoreductase [Pseudomonadota bacterium]MBU2228092.1 SDR family oxidoreductase [Pseudomonadota bacterium]MBU2261409.1 SDR family oxidoreductase [Pseudomonadota bacterium]
MDDLFALQGKVAIVTGAAQGIGREIAIGFSRYGADIVAVDLNEELLLGVKKEIETESRRCLALKVDLGSIDQINGMTETAVQEMGRIDILANIAGVNVHKPAEDMTEQEWDFVQDINLKSLFFCCQSVGRVMLKQGSGRIINMSSSFGIVGFGGRTAYASSKAAVSNLTKTLAIEWSAKGVNVNAIAPGPVWTPARDHLFSNPEFYNNLMTKLPIKRTAKPAEIVGPAIFLASEASSFMTGATLLVDGGWCAQ